MEARVTVEGADSELESLWDWLRQEPDLRGRLNSRLVSGDQNAMGAPVELVITGTSISVAITALARSISVWLVQRRSDVTVRVTGPDGRQVSVSSKRVADSEHLIRAVLDASNRSANARED